MKRRKKSAYLWVPLLSLALSTLAGCGPDTSKNSPTSQTMAYFPLALGNSWTYLVTDGAVEKSKTSTVEGYEDVGADHAGTMAYRLRTEKLDGETVSWQGVSGQQLLRYREQNFALAQVLEREESYDPYKLRLDERAEHLELGASWTQNYSESATDYTSGSPLIQPTVTKVEQWTVQALEELITVPAGEFECLRVQRSGAATKTYWFAKGVGKIKEQGQGQIEELESYTLP